MGLDGADRMVTCIACGMELPRSQAREYDKYGDRWDREGKTFEYFCKPCYEYVDDQPRRGLEGILESVGAGRVPDSVFLEGFVKRNGTEDVENEQERS